MKTTSGKRRVACIFFSLVVSSTVAAAQTSSAGLSLAPSISFSHNPPARAVAGDSLKLPTDVAPSCPASAVCSRIEVVASYTSRFGKPLEAKAIAPGPEAGRVNVTIPGEEVRYPSFSYSLSSRIYDQAGRVIAVSPESSQLFEVPVDNVIRFSLKRPGGGPAAGVRVVWGPFRNEAKWLATTDASGALSLVLPSQDAHLKARETEPGYENIYLWAFDAFPKQAPRSGPVTVQGNGLHLAYVANLGDELIEAADPNIQDHSFSLEPEKITFSSEADQSSLMAGCSGGSNCEQENQLPNRPVRLAFRVGGGSEMMSRYVYESSDFTSFEVALSTGFSGWVSGKGEVMSDQKTTGSIDSQWRGPNENKMIITGWDMVSYEKVACSRGLCYRYDRIVPIKWTTDNYYEDTPYEIHDTAEPFGGADCTRRSGNPFSTTDQRGSQLRFTIDAGGSLGPVEIGARTSYGNGGSQKSIHSWKLPDGVEDGPGHLYHHRFVNGGATGSGEDRCPETHPGAAWTDTAEYDKTLPKAGGTDGCTPVGGRFSPDAKPDLCVKRADGTPSEFVMFNKKANPSNDYQMTKTALRRGSNYLWSAGNLQTYTAYSMRLSKRYQGNDPPLDSGVWQSNPFDRDLVDTGTNICGNVINLNPTAGLYEYSIFDNLIGYRETNGTPSGNDDHWAITPTSQPFPSGAANGNPPAGTYDICVTPTTRSVTASVPVGVNGTSVEITVL